MTRTELLEKIRGQFLVFKNDNRALPKYKGLPDMLDAMIEVLDGGVAGEDLNALKEQLQALQDQLSNLVAGLSEEEVQAKIDAALHRIDTELVAIQQKNSQQDNAIQAIQQDIEDLPGAAALNELENALKGLRSDLQANQQRDDQQEDQIQKLVEDLEETVSKSDLQGIELDLIANNQRDDQQEVDIQQLQQDILNLSSNEQVEALKEQLSALEASLQLNGQKDEAQDNAIEALKQLIAKLEKELGENLQLDTRQQAAIDKIINDLQQIPTNDLLQEIRSSLSDLETNLVANGQKDDQQQIAIDQLKEALKTIPTDAALVELRKLLTQLQSTVQANAQLDEQQQQALNKIKEDLALLPSKEALQSILESIENIENTVSANLDQDAQQQLDIDKLKRDILNIPTDAAIEEIRGLITTLQTDLAANDAKDEQQQQALASLQQALLDLPTKRFVDELKTQLEDLEKSLAANQDLDANQQTDIDQLKADILSIPTSAALNELKEALARLESDLQANTQLDTEQQSAIAKLQEGILAIPTDAAIKDIQNTINQLKKTLAANQQLDTDQQAAIEKLQQDILEIPTNAAIEQLRTAVEVLETALAASEARNDKQAANLASINKWRAATILTLENITKRLDSLENDGGDLDALKTEILVEVQKVKKELADRISLLEPLVGQLSALEAQLNAIDPGIDEATAKAIAEEKVTALKQLLEERLRIVEEKAGQISSIHTRLTKAEADIVELFERLTNGDPTDPSGEVNKAYVKAELGKLQALLQKVINGLDTKFTPLLALPTELQKLATTLATKVTASQVSDLIESAIAGLVKQQDLLDLEQQLQQERETLRTTIQQSYEDYIKEQLTQIEIKIKEADDQLKQQMIGLLEEGLSDFWKDVVRQPLPTEWLKQVLEEMRTLDNDVRDQAKAWDDDLRVDFLAADTALASDLLQQISQSYASKEALANQKNALIEEIAQQISTFANSLPTPLTEEAVKAIVADEVQRLVTEIKARVQDLEGLNLDDRLKTLEAFTTSLETLNLETFRNFVLNLNLPTVISLVNAINTWKTETEPKLDDLEERLEELREEFETSPASDVANRLSRICLNGWGIVGGLEIYSDSDYCVHVSAGEGVTPDGQLIVIPAPTSFIGYYALSDEDKTGLEYPLLNDIPIWRLIETTQEKTIDGVERRWLTPQTNREKDVPFSSDKLVLLLPDSVFILVRLEDYLRLTKKLETTRKMIGGERDFEYSDYLFSSSFSPADNAPGDDILYRAFQPSLNLGSIPLHRFGFRPGDDCTVEELDETDFPATLNNLKALYDTWKPIIDEALNTVNDKVAELIKAYHPLLFPQLPAKTFRETLQILLSNWKAYTQFVERDDEQPEKCYVQYFYDWARDLIRGYHECRNELQVLMAELCLQTKDSFSSRNKHIALGPAFRPDQDGLAAPVRDGFRQPPIYNGNADRWERTRLYYRRLFELIESFYIEGAIPEDRLPAKFRREEDDPFSPDFSNLKITPGRQLGAPLSEQAIPFYYPLTGGSGSLHYYWSYEQAKKRSQDQHLSYHASDGFESYNHPDDWHITRPLYYVLDSYDFYRIAGHIGQREITIDGITFNEAFQGMPKADPDLSVVGAIKYLAQKHNLDFSVVGKKVSEDLADTFPMPGTVGFFNTFKTELLGAEHLGGVPKGGTFIVIVDDNNTIIADFAVPYRMPTFWQPPEGAGA